MTLKGNYASKCVTYATLGLFNGKDVCIANRCSAFSAVAEPLVYIRKDDSCSLPRTTFAVTQDTCTSPRLCVFITATNRLGLYECGVFIQEY